VSIGIDEEYIPEFTLGSAKYPVTATIDVAATLASSLDKTTMDRMKNKRIFGLELRLFLLNILLFG
jgi:hypothetical protein